MKQSKLISLILALVIVLLAFTGCGEKEETKTESAGSQAASSQPAQSDASQPSTTPSSPDQSNSNDPSTPSAPSALNDADAVAKGFITTKDAFTAKLSGLIDLSLYQPLSEGTSIYTYTLDSKNHEDYPLDYKVKLEDDTEFTLPITLNELKKKGWTHNLDENHTMEAHTYFLTSTTLSNPAGKEISVGIENDSDQTLSLGECTVYEVVSNQYRFSKYTQTANEAKFSKAAAFTVCNTITNQSTMEDVIAQLGNPYNIYLSVSHDGNGNFKTSSITLTYDQKSLKGELKLSFSGDTKYLTEITYKTW